ncbi:MAG: GatB/YqeY domain-containing protein [Tannerellaceae bacterium]|jgi:uncharacterized protein YqeY|nr:GatB/YqeY domain-containing protein [Tannerellaceae bacterium]
MNLFEQVSEDIKAAMLAKEKIRLQALRGVKKEFIEAKTAKGSDGDLNDESAVKILQKMVKQRKDSANIFVSQGRPELAENELAEIAVIEEYLPKQLSADELESAIADIIKQTGAQDPKEMGKVIGAANKALAGKAEGKAIAEIVKKLLN